MFWASWLSCCGLRRLLPSELTGSIAGSVTDASQAAVPGAEVVVRNLATEAERRTVTNEVGFYTVTALPAGRYSIVVSRQGFMTYSIPEFVIQVDQQATVNVELKVGEVTETVTVAGALLLPWKHVPAR